MNLQGATVLVTGANRGIGLALAQAFARQPLGRLLAGMREPLDSLPGLGDDRLAEDVQTVALDLSSRESIDAGLAALGGLAAEIDVLVNNAGLMTGGLLEDQDLQEVYAMFQVNLLATVHLCHAVLPGMLTRGRGKIVNNASISGYAYFPAATTYAASKAGVVALSEALRRELRGTGVDVLHLVTPGVQTDMLSATDEVYGRHIDTSSWERLAPDDWAARVLAAIESDTHVLGPGGRTALAKLASRGPAWLLDSVSSRMFSRKPRD